MKPGAGQQALKWSPVVPAVTAAHGHTLFTVAPKLLVLTTKLFVEQNGLVLWPGMASISVLACGSGVCCLEVQKRELEGFSERTLCKRLYRRKSMSRVKPNSTSSSISAKPNTSKS